MPLFWLLLTAQRNQMVAMHPLLLHLRLRLLLRRN
jgi:hypothetical protein